MKTDSLRDYVRLLKKRFGSPDLYPLGRVSSMVNLFPFLYKAIFNLVTITNGFQNVAEMDRVLARYYNANYLLDGVFVEYLKTRFDDDKQPLINNAGLLDIFNIR